MTHCCEGDFHNALSRNRCGGGRSSSHCSTSLWCPCPCSSNCTAFGDDLGDSSADTGNGDKKDDSDVDEGTLAFLRIFAPDVYEKIQMKRLIKRDIIVERPDVQWSDIANQVKAKKLLQVGRPFRRTFASNVEPENSRDVTVQHINNSGYHTRLAPH
ncbi:uncharacterized protein LOC103511756 [Diaphorina citri]|uniref:Uncharacterized protein LOC103511756 n=1 Tax=Diaphorina citri TaxID=121845 RepID=A0A3Q0IY96_DIACI|nr:uncharacterized protein LOC103511756 [Diaphorina citri]